MSRVRPWTTRIASFLPAWLTRRPELEWAFKLAWTWALFSDIAVQAAIEGMRAAWPGYDARTDNLALIGSSRALVQGESETAASFARRLRNWLVSALDMGGDEGLAFQLHFWIGNNPMVRVWSRNGRCTTCAPGSFTVTQGSSSVTASTSQNGILSPGDVVLFQPGPLVTYKILTVTGTAIVLTTPYQGASFTTAAAAIQVAKVAGGWSGPGPLSGLGLNWDTVSNPERATDWWNQWIVIYPSEFAGAGNLGARAGGIDTPALAIPGLGIGHLCTRVQYETIRGLIGVWKGQHAVIRWIIWTNDATLFDPLNPGASGNPDGNWGSWSVLKTVMGTTSKFPALNPNCRYWKGQV